MNVVSWLGSKMNDGTAAVGRALVTRWGRKWADGDFGPAATRVYYWLSTHAGAITWSVGGLAAGLAMAAQMPERLTLLGLSASQVELWSVRLAYVAPVLVSLKLATDKWHDLETPAWCNSPVGVWLKEHSALLTYLSGGAWWYAERCGGGGWCDVERWVVFVVAVVGANFGILPRSAQSIPPAKVLEGLAGLITAPTPPVAAQAAAIAQLPDALTAQGMLSAAAILSPATDPDTKAGVKMAVAAVAEQVKGG